MGQHVGSHLLDVLFVREKGFKREIKLLSMLIFIKSNFWKVRQYTDYIAYPERSVFKKKLNSGEKKKNVRNLY